MYAATMRLTQYSWTNLQLKDRCWQLQTLEIDIQSAFSMNPNKSKGTRKK